MKYNRAWAIEAVKQGTPITIFYGHTPKSEKVDVSCMSQWFPCRFTVDGRVYATAEQYMMAEKARLFGDEETRQQILQATDPRVCKELGRKVRNFDQELWNTHCVDIVVAGNLAKFSQNASLKEFLLSTGESILTEGSPSDCIWGIGRVKSDPLSQDPASWKGTNLLGFALMEVRDKLRE